MYRVSMTSEPRPNTVFNSITHLGKKKLGQTTARVNRANTSCGLANFSPVVHILVFIIPGPKILHSHSCAGRECGTFGQDITKNKLLIVCEFTILCN